MKKITGYIKLQIPAGAANPAIEKLGITGPSLTFITYPTAITLFPFAAGLFGILFYLALFTFGLDSAFSMIEPLRHRNQMALNKRQGDSNHLPSWFFHKPDFHYRRRVVLA